MNIRNNLLVDLKKKYLQDLNEFYDSREAEQLLTILIEHFFGITRNELILNPDSRISESEILKLHMAVKELKQHKPVQYITGVVEFQDLKIEVTPDVLIPRPETEELVQFIVQNEKASGLKILDIGTGSGCIAISLKKLLENVNINATDISESAIRMARKNAGSNNQDIVFHIHDILSDKEAISDKNGDRILFDIIVSNPPYVTQEDKKKMHHNVTDYEPHNALFVPEDNPLLYYEAILGFSIMNLNSGGRIYFEINESLGSQMIALFEDHGFLNVELKKDLSEKDRFVFGVKTQSSSSNKKLYTSL